MLVWRDSSIIAVGHGQLLRRVAPRHHVSHSAPTLSGCLKSLCGDTGCSLGGEAIYFSVSLKTFVIAFSSGVALSFSECWQLSFTLSSCVTAHSVESHWGQLLANLFLSPPNLSFWSSEREIRWWNKQEPRKFDLAVDVKHWTRLHTEVIGIFIARLL